MIEDKIKQMKNIFIVLLVLALSSCADKKTAIEKEIAIISGDTITLTAAQLKNASLSYGKLEQNQMATILKVNGRVDVPPQNMVSISVPLGGYLKNTKLLPGMHINKGEVIAVIQDQQYIDIQQDYILTKSKIAYSQLEYNRQKDLNASKASSDKVLQQVAAELNGLRITLSGLSEKLKLIGKNPASVSQKNLSSYIYIYAPIDGYVTKVNVNIGKYISPTDVIFELVNPTDIHLALKVFEKDINKLFIGQKLVAYTNNNPDDKHDCEILLIGKNLSAEGNTEVHCHFESYDKNLIPGTYMNAEIALTSANSYVLPEDAVVRFENKHYAFIQQGNSKFIMTEVEVGNDESGLIEIKTTEQIKNATFVTKNAYTLLMALKNISED